MADPRGPVNPTDAESAAAQPGESNRRPAAWIPLALAALTLLAYARVLGFGFLNYDDPAHVTHNPHVRAGLGIDSIVWAFTTFSQANWFPLTWLSHMLSFELFGTHAGMHHLVNLVIHIFAALALFGFLSSLTGARWPSAFVAAVFALHPMHVESVAWITERKDVLCALFWFLGSWAWVRDSERRGPGRYLDTLVLFALGLMSKPMIVTFPLTLVLLDCWRTRRFSLTMVLGKWPFFVLSLASGVVTVLAQNSAGAVQSLSRLSLGLRLENAVITVWIYLFRTIWPADLALPYSWPASFSLIAVLCGALAIVVVSILAVRLFGKRPYLAFGWFWFLITILPVIGLVQVGPQARADRYMYVPMVGVSIALAWAAWDLAQSRPPVRKALATLGAVAVVAMSALTWIQVGYWKTAEVLFRHAAAVTENNYLAYSYLGTQLLATRAAWPEALTDYQSANRIHPGPAEHTNLANMYYLMGRFPDATGEYRLALAADPGSASAHDGLGKVLARTPGRLTEAIDQFQTASRLDPKNEEARIDAAKAYLDTGQFSAAIDALKGELQISPNNPTAENLLGMALMRTPGRQDDAVEHLEAALALAPDYADAHNNLGIALQASGRLSMGIEHFEAAVKINPRFAEAQHNLGVALLGVPGRESEGNAHLQIERNLKTASR